MNEMDNDEIDEILMELATKDTIISQQRKDIFSLKNEIENLKNIIATLTCSKIKRGEKKEQISGNLYDIIVHNIVNTDIHHVLCNYSTDSHCNFIVNLLIGTHKNDISLAVLDMMIAYKDDNQFQFVHKNDFLPIIISIIKPFISQYVDTIMTDTGVSLQQTISDIDFKNKICENFVKLISNNFHISKRIIKLYQSI